MKNIIQYNLNKKNININNKIDHLILIIKKYNKRTIYNFHFESDKLKA